MVRLNFRFLSSTEFEFTPAESSEYGRYNPSVDSHASFPSVSPFADPGVGSVDHYPAWSADRQIPMSTEEIEDIFLDLTQKFGFQRDSMRNMVCGAVTTSTIPTDVFFRSSTF